MTRQMDRTEWLLLLTLSVPWGGSFFFYKILAPALPPLTVAFGRVAIAAAALIGVLLMRGAKGRRDWHEPGLVRGRWGSFLLMGLLNNAVPFTLFAWGEQRIDSGLAAIFNATTPIFAVLVLHMTTETERLTRNRAIGVVLGFAGVAVLVGPQRPGGSSIAGALACLLAAFTYACAAAYGRRFRALPPLVSATGQITGASLLLLPAAAVIDHPWTLPAPPAGAWASLLGLGLLCTAFAYLLYFRILATAGAGNLMLVTFLVPVTALLLGHFALSEPITGAALAGMALIACGLAAIDGRILRLLAANRGRPAALRSTGSAGETSDERPD